MQRKRRSSSSKANLRAFAVSVCILLLCGCANLQTVSRTTSIPAPTYILQQNTPALPQGAKSSAAVKISNGRAIHLDAQQRLVITTVRGFCAEPSPDAMAAYASALGFSAKNSTQNSVAASNAINSAAANIGLRTQSITLMRDTLYRMCEAYLNGQVDEIQVATLIGRSMDLTAVILAIEQLTGATAASQVALTPGGSANASSILVSNQQALDLARKKLTAKEAVEAETKLKADSDEKDRVIAEAALTAAQDKLANVEASDTSTQSEKDTAKADLAAADSSYKSSALSAKNSLSKYNDAKTAREDAQDLVQTIADTRDAAILESSAQVSSGSTFGSPIKSVVFDKGAAEHISKAVSGMIGAVLNKRYLEEACAELIFAGPTSATPEAQATYTASVDYCSDLNTIEQSRLQLRLNSQ